MRLLTRNVLLMSLVFFVCGAYISGFQGQGSEKGKKSLGKRTTSVGTRPNPPATKSQTAISRLKPKVSFEERLLATIPYQFEMPKVGGGWGLNFSPDGTRVAYVAQQGGKQFIVVGNKKGPEFDEVT